MSTEKRIIAESRKLAALRERIRDTVYLTGPEVRAHFGMSRAMLDAVPFAVLPWVPGNGTERVVRRYHPADVEAYPARARRWRSAIDRGEEAAVLERMEAEIAERDERLMQGALEGHAA